MIMNGQGVELWKKMFPVKSMFWLLFIGMVDLVTTAVLHAQGKIVELNPIMRPIIESSEWLFALVKGGSIVLAWLVMLKYSKTHLEFISRACLAGTLLYGGVWFTWFTIGTFA